MPFDHLADFPIPAAELPPRLRALLTPEGLTPDARVLVAAMQNLGRADGRREHLQMVMAVVPNVVAEPMTTLREAGDGVVAYSTPFGDHEGEVADFTPSVSGHDYVVASWGDGTSYGYHLAEKVWMTLGLKPRCEGGDHQRLTYDDMTVPTFDVVSGDISTQHEFHLQRDVAWRMSNTHLRQYLWLRGAKAARVFFYETLMPDGPGLRALMDGEKHVVFEPKDGWYTVDIREHLGGLFIQVWATVVAVTSERCALPSADGLDWPGHGPITADEANALVAPELVYLDDRFLERYEQNAAFDTTPIWVGQQRWHVSPSYRGQWSFTECVRVGRNLIQVPLRELYKPKPDQEIVHAHGFALDPGAVAHFNLEEEHVAAKTQRLLDAFLDLADALVMLGRSVDLTEPAIELTKLSRVELRAEGWRPYPQLSRLAQVAPLSMSRAAFLARCKSLHEFWQVLPNGYLKRLLAKAGVPQKSMKDLGSLKLLQGLLNILQALNRDHDDVDAFVGDEAPAGWNERNDGLAGLFVLADLRIADAHEVDGPLARLEDLGVDMAGLAQGHGRALDVVFDQAINAFARITSEIETLLAR